MSSDSIAKISIIDGGVQDIASIMPIMNSAFDPQYGEAWNSEQCFSMLSLPYTEICIALHGEEISGFAFTRSLYEDVELLMIATHPDCRRMGIAAHIMNRIIAKAHEQKRHRIFLEMRENNYAEKLYDVYGFTNISTRRNYYRGNDNSRYNAITKELIL